MNAPQAPPVDSNVRLKQVFELKVLTLATEMVEWAMVGCVGSREQGNRFESYVERKPRYVFGFQA